MTSLIPFLTCKSNTCIWLLYSLKMFVNFKAITCFFWFICTCILLLQRLYCILTDMHSSLAGLRLKPVPWKKRMFVLPATITPSPIHCLSLPNPLYRDVSDTNLTNVLVLTSCYQTNLSQPVWCQNLCQQLAAQMLQNIQFILNYPGNNLCLFSRW